MEIFYNGDIPSCEYVLREVKLSKMVLNELLFMMKERNSAIVDMIKQAIKASYQGTRTST